MQVIGLGVRNMNLNSETIKKDFRRKLIHMFSEDIDGASNTINISFWKLDKRILC
jgi:hypothetical protein